MPRHTRDEILNIRAQKESQAATPVEEAQTPETISEPLKSALETRARQLGIPVSDLTPDQIEEVRASLATEEPAAEKPAPKARGGRRRAKPEK